MNAFGTTRGNTEYHAALVGKGSKAQLGARAAKYRRHRGIDRRGQVQGCAVVGEHVNRPLHQRRRFAEAQLAGQVH